MTLDDTISKLVEGARHAPLHLFTDWTGLGLVDEHGETYMADYLDLFDLKDALEKRATVQNRKTTKHHLVWHVKLDKTGLIVAAHRSSANTNYTCVVGFRQPNTVNDLFKDTSHHTQMWLLNKAAPLL